MTHDPIASRPPPGMPWWDRALVRSTLAAVVILTVGVSRATADQCISTKLQAIGKKESGLLRCQSTVAAKNDASGLVHCEEKVSGKFLAAFARAGACIGVEATCATQAGACETTVASAMTDTFPSKCEAVKRKAAGKLAGTELRCYAKAAAKGIPLDASCIAGAQGVFSAAVNAAANTNGACPDGGSPSGPLSLVENSCVKPAVTTDGGGTVIDLCPTTTSTTSTTSTSTTSTSVTSTTSTTTLPDPRCSGGFGTSCGTNCSCTFTRSISDLFCADLGGRGPNPCTSDSDCSPDARCAIAFPPTSLARLIRPISFPFVCTLGCGGEPCTSSDGTCGGPCAQAGQVCTQAPGGTACACALPDNTCGISVAPTCGGTCPTGSVCLSAGSSCTCVAADNTCGYSQAPTCGGTCPSGEVCGQGTGSAGFCTCVPPDNTCVISQAPSCGGTCASTGQVCTQAPGGNTCACASPDNTCGISQAPTCGGTCPTPGDSCLQPPGGTSCTCAPPDNTCGISVAPTCGGTCPSGEVCGQGTGTNACTCVPPDNTCGISQAPTCGGTCPTPGDSCLQHLGGASCTCVPPGCVDASGTFCDRGDGTVYDAATNLTWEKKDTGVSGVNPGDLHDVDNRYAWAGCCNGDCSAGEYLCQPNAAAAVTCLAHADGGTQGCSVCGSGTCNVYSLAGETITTVWDWLNGVNAASFAGHSDWRLPSENGCNSCYSNGPPYNCPCAASELETILLASYPCGTSPCIASIFGPTASSYYWSASTYSAFPAFAWDVYFFNGVVTYDNNAYGFYVRAVR